MITLARQLSSLNNRTRFESIQQCYQPLNLEELKKLVICQHALPPTTNPSLNSTKVASWSPPTTNRPLNLTQATYSSNNQIKNLNSQFIQNLKDQISLIEAPAITARTTAEIICSLLKIDDKTTESISSFTENASRLMAIGMHYGTRSMVNSLAVPLLVTSAKATDSIVKKAGYTPPSEKFDDLISNLNSYRAFQVTSDYYKDLPEWFKNSANQMVFVLLMYTTRELLDRNIENEANRDSPKLKLTDSIVAHFVTSVASGVFRIIGSTVAKSIKSYMSTSRESPAIDSSADLENSANTFQVQPSTNSPHNSPRNLATTQTQSSPSSSIVYLE